MKILSITAQKPNSTGSGIYLTELVRSWKRQGHTQAVVAGFAAEETVPKWEGITGYPVFYGGEALPFPVLGMSDEMPYPSTRYRDLTQVQMEQFEKAFYAVISRAVEQEQPDWIVCHHLYLLTALVRKWFPDRRIVGICHGSDLRQMIKNTTMALEIAPWIAKLDRIVALQQAQKEEILRLFRCREDRIEVLGAGYNPSVFHGKEEDKIREKEEKQLIFAGKVTEKKGVFSLLRALKRLEFPREALRVVIAGGPGPQEEFCRIRALAEESPYPIEFTGALPQTELAERFRQSDVFVLPSFFEGLPLVTIEAMACGCKVVCSDLPGLRQWFQTNVPGAQVGFVMLPDRTDADEPEAEQLPQFERELAHAMTEKLLQQEPEHPDLSALSWEGLSRRILQRLEASEFDDEL